MKKTYNVDVDCANCAAKMEDAVKKTPADVDAVMAAAQKNCKRVESDCEIFL